MVDLFFDFIRYSIMWKSLLLLVFMIGGITVRAVAQNHFIYLQSETNKAFTVTVNNKNYSSTGTGYVIIPRLKTGEYNLMVRFKQSNTVDTKFTAVIDKKDVGYIVKENGNSAVGLVDLQTYASLNGSLVDLTAKNDNLLPVENEVDKTFIAKAGAEKKPTGKKGEKMAANTPPHLKKGITKISEMQNSGSFSLLFIDVQSMTTDTIDVVIPIGKNDGIKSSFYKPAYNSLFKWASANATQDLEFEYYQNGYNTKCVHLVTKEDYARLRKKMAAESNADKMIEAALRVTKTKCLETVQVKKLANLFNKESGKYKFFEAVYSFVYDYIEYRTLEEELSDELYRDKFRSLLSK